MLAVALLVAFFIQVCVGDDDLTEGLEFLNQYGYISHTRSGNHDVPTAIRNFQEYFGLPASGKLDDSTIRLMKKPRCGMPDPTGESRKRRYVTRSKWYKTELTYYVQPGLDLPAEQQKEIFAKALQYWADVSKLSFRSVESPSEADIKISFGTYSHNGTNGEGICPYPFRGAGGVLAHAYYPRDGRAHFDEDETYTHDTKYGVNLLWVATHEFGHSLGLDHTNVQGAIMYPYYTGYVPDMKLHSDDIAGIQYLYGSNDGTDAGGGGETPAPPSDCDDRLASSCQPYVEAGYCDTYPSNMKYWCEKSCSKCQ